MTVVQTRLAGCFCAFTVLFWGTTSPLVADDAAPEEPAASRPVAFLTVHSPLNDAQFARVQNAALRLKIEAAERNQDALLVLEIPSGTSPFHTVQGLARFLTSGELARVTTVAWVPEDVTGNNVVLALACEEIIVHPDKQIGDIGRGQALDEDELQQVLNIVEKGANPRVNRAVALKLADPRQSLVKIKIRRGGELTTEFVTGEELGKLQAKRLEIPETNVLIDAGVSGLFTGQSAREWDVLVTHTAQSLADVAALYDLPGSALRENLAADGELNVRLIKITGMIDGPQAEFVKRQLDRAVRKGANVVIFEVDSPGGRLDAMQDIAFAIADIDPKKVRTVAYVPDDAISAAAVISLACDELYMQPYAKIGDAGPIELRPGQAFERASEKIVSYMLKMMQELAEKKDRPSALLKAMVDRDIEVYRVVHRDTGRVWYMTEAEIHASAGEWIKKEMVPESRKGILLTVNGTEAHKLKLAEPPVADFDELKQRLGIPASTVVAPMEETWVDSLVFYLNNPAWASTLLTIAMVCLFIELHFMTGALAIASALFFALFFWSKYMGGTAGWLEVILFVIGLVCLALEIFVLPGFGVFGIMGGVLVLLALVMASQTFGHEEPGRDMELLAKSLSTVTLSIAAVVIVSAILNRFLPSMPLMKGMVLAGPDDTSPQLRVDVSDGATGVLSGMTGKAQSVLRPAGKAWIDDRLMDVVSDGSYIEAGSAIEVVAVTGNVIVVRKV